MIKRPPKQRLELASLQIHILGGVNPGLLDVAQWFGAQSTESDDQNLGRLRLHPGQQVHALFRAQIEQKQGRPVLLQDRIEPLGLRHMAQLGEAAEIGACPPNEIWILRVKNARGGWDHAAATSSSKRTRGSRM